MSDKVEPTKVAQQIAADIKYLTQNQEDYYNGSVGVEHKLSNACGIVEKLLDLGFYTSTVEDATDDEH